MKDKALIYQGDPCTMRLAAPEIQTLEDVGAQGAGYCRYYGHPQECSPPCYGCVQVAGLKVARYVLLFYSEASERTLALEVDKFREMAPLPPEQVQAYIDTPEYAYRRIADAELVVQRVAEFAKAVLDLKPEERVFRDSVEAPPPPPKSQRLRVERAAARAPAMASAIGRPPGQARPPRGNRWAA